MPKRAVFRLEGTQPTMIVGYARTSTTDQAAGLAAQERDLTAAGAASANKFSSTAKRVKLAECLAFMREGDVLAVTKPDRLARSTAELLAIEADLSKRGIGLVVLSMGGERLDTLASAAFLSIGPGSPRDLHTVAPDAGRILLRIIYGWFERTQCGVYRLTVTVRRRCGVGRTRVWSMPRMRWHFLTAH
jgi:Resolvase, N terminal domain/Putative PD-(D/E)XK phosphodiesterase (DUF2161)